jgi:hypothetical protein
MRAALAIISIIIVVVIVVVVPTGMTAIAAAVFAAEADFHFVALRTVFSSGGVIVVLFGIVPVRRP